MAARPRGAGGGVGAGASFGGQGALRALARLVALIALGLLAAEVPGHAQATPLPYDLGSPAWVDVWVDPVHGDDTRSGATRATALRTITAAWNRLPERQELSQAVRIQLTAGTWDVDAGGFPHYWESRWGTAEHPILLQAADGPRTARLRGNVNVFDCRYLYLVGLVIDADGGDVLHFEGGHHLLLRDLEVDGAAPETYAVQEVLKVNQAQHVYLEGSDLHGAWDNAVDFVAVADGHVLANRIHDAGWCIYLKGGSARFAVDGNEIFDCEIGLVAGQGTGFEYLTPPWLHYEAYDLALVNNVVHHTSGIGLGVYGGYNILVAHNTLYRVGANSHLIDVVFGERTCDGEVARCAEHLALGGWGTVVPGDAGRQPIPNRNVYVFNNLIVNPPGAATRWQHLTVFGPTSPAADANLPAVVHADDGLIVRGNWIWNGPADHPLGVEGDADGCRSDHPTCSPTALREENSINQSAPALVAPEAGDFRLAAGTGLPAAVSAGIPPFPGGDRPQPPLAPAGNLANRVERDRDGVRRGPRSWPGAYAGPEEPGACVPDAATLCLGAGSRFAVTAHWRSAGGAAGQASAVPLTAETGWFWFFQPTNLELVVKVLDGCGVNQHHWVFAAGLTNVGVELRVFDHGTGEARTYASPPGRAHAPLQDARAFAGCRSGPARAADTGVPDVTAPGGAR
jgi:hypothetical protein